MTNIEMLDAGLRGGAAALLGLIAVALLLRASAPAARLVALFAVGMVGYVLISSPVYGPHLGLARGPIGLLAAANPALFWWAALALFDDGFRLTPLRAAVVVPVVGLALVSPLAPELAGYARAGVVAVLYISIIHTAWTTREGDLVEPRRQFRVWFMIVAAVFGLVTMAGELPVLRGAVTAEATALHGAGLLVLAAAFAFWALTPREGVWPSPRPNAAPRDLRDVDRALLERLERAMEAEIWRREGLTIAALAAELDAPEHRVRRVINGALGHRNFAAFLGARRIEAAKAALADPAHADAPVLSIAYEVGYGSVGPFNRAFRAATGESPTEFRRRALATRRN